MKSALKDVYRQYIVKKSNLKYNHDFFIKYLRINLHFYRTANRPQENLDWEIKFITCILEQLTNE